MCPWGPEGACLALRPVPPPAYRFWSVNQAFHCVSLHLKSGVLHPFSCAFISCSLTGSKLMSSLNGVNNRAKFNNLANYQLEVAVRAN